MPSGNSWTVYSGKTTMITGERMRESLAELYRRTQTSPSLEARLPEDVGVGRIARICTPQGLGLSTWEMCYHRDTPVEGAVGNELRLLFCLGEGVEWQNSTGKTSCVQPSRACLCMGEGSAERMRYASGYGYAFRQVSITRDHASHLVNVYLPEMEIDKLAQVLDGRDFPVTGNMRRLLDGFDAPGMAGGLGLMRLECRAYELMALCLEQALGFGGHVGLHPDDLAAVRSVRDRIEADAASVPDIATLARECSVSASKLSRDFKRAYGVSIHACVIEARLEEAARLLSSGQMSVAAVAERVGYARHSQFSEAFWRRFGALPKDY